MLEKDCQMFPHDFMISVQKITFNEFRHSFPGIYFPSANHNSPGQAVTNKDTTVCRQPIRTLYFPAAASLSADFLENTMIHAAGLPQAYFGVTQALCPGHKPKHNLYFADCLQWLTTGAQIEPQKIKMGKGGDYEFKIFNERNLS